MGQPPVRARPKLSMTCEANTVNIVNHLIDQHKVKNIGQAVDLMANFYSLMGESAKKDASQKEGIMAEMEQRVAEKTEEALQRSYENLAAVMAQNFAAVKELLAAEQKAIQDGLKEVIKLEVERAYAKYADLGIKEPKALEPDYGPPMEPQEAEYTFEDLVRKCPGTTPKQVEDWTEAWKKDIIATGHTVDEFVAAKIMRFAKTAKPAAVAQAKIENGGVEQKRADVKQRVNWAMVDYWMTKNSAKADQAGMTSTKEFHVAHAIEKLAFVVREMDNGSGEKFLDEIEDSLRRSALDRKWDVGAFMNDYNRITMDAVKIKERYADTVKK